MNVELRGESVVVTGYVNAVERYSKPITSKLRGMWKTFIERMRAGVFKTALKRNDSVKVLLNHNWDRELADTKDGTAKLEEDNIGLRAEVIITDSEVVEKARQGKLVGWSFGFRTNADELGMDGEVETRTVTDIDLFEVSILDDSKRPAYNGTSIETRSEGGVMMEIRENITEEQTEEQTAEQTTEVRVEGVDLNALAEVLANKVAEKVKITFEEVREHTVDEEVTEEETEEMTAEEETAKEDTAVEEERCIDYSAFEQRIANIN